MYHMFYIVHPHLSIRYTVCIIWFYIMVFLVHIAEMLCRIM